MRSLIGPVMVAAAVWTAAGSLTLATDSAGVRLVQPASALWGLAGLLAGLAFPAWRRSPLLAAPALLTVLPWVPLPLPPAALLWTGTLAWVPVGIAVMCALVVRPAGLLAPAPWGPALRVGSVGRQAVAAGLATLVAGGLVWASVRDRLPGGDEPHYLVITQSLLKDGDLRIENNHVDRDYAVYWGGTLAPHFVQRGQDGEIYSIHAPGVSAIVAPGFALAGLAGAQWTILVLAAVAGVLIWLSGWYATRDQASAWFAWAAVAGSVTLLLQSVTIFPDGPGAVIAAAAAVVWLRLRRGDRVTTPVLVAVSGLLAVMPFLHTRFVVLAAGLGLAIASALWTTSTRATDTVGPIRRVATFFALPAVGAVLWFGFFLAIYGTPSPTIAYGSNSESRLLYVPGGLAGLLFDQQFGLFAFSPVLALAVVGWCARGRECDGRRLWPLAAVAGVYLAAVATYWMWWAGVPGTPARLSASVLPLLAAPLAVMWQGSGPARRMTALVLLVTSLAISIRLLGFDAGHLAWSDRGAHAAWLAALGSVADLSRAWPSFFWRLVGGDVSSQAPFAVHLLVWVFLIAAFSMAATLVARSSKLRVHRVVATAGFALLAGAMTLAQAGWWMNGVSGVRPASSQLALLRTAASGAPVLEIRPFAIRPVGTDVPSLQVVVPRVDLPGDARVAWAALRGVPAGRYDLRLSAPRPTGGTLTISTGGRSQSLQVITLPRQSRHHMQLDLPVGVENLRFAADDELAAGGGTLVVVPQAVYSGVHAPARAKMRAFGVDVYVMGDGAYVEERALWVRGGQRAQLTLASTHASARSLKLVLTNGPMANAVVVDVAGDPVPLDLEPGAQTVVPVAVGQRRPVQVSVSSSAGFRPADDGQSADERYLGVRIEFTAVDDASP